MKTVNRFRGRNLLVAAGLAGLAVTSCSNGSKSTAGADECQMIKDDAGMQACSPGCELTLVPDNPTSGASDAGTGPSTAKCVPKQQKDASPTTEVSGEVEESDTGYVSVPDASVPDVTPTPVDTATVTPKDAGPVCTPTKKDRVYVNLGNNYSVAGNACQDTEGSPSALDDGSTIQRKSEDGVYRDCAVTANPKLVTLACQTGTESALTINASADGCTQTAAEIDPCTDGNKITVTGSTTVNSDRGSRTIVKVSATQSQELYLPSDGSQSITKNLNLAGTPITATFTSLGEGADGKVVVVGSVAGPSGKSVCGTPVGGSPVVIGDVTVSRLVGEADVMGDSAFSSDLVYADNENPRVSENGPVVNFGGSLVNVSGTVANGASGGVKLDETTGQGRSCVLQVGENSAGACNISYDGKAVTLKAVYHTDSCTTAKADDAGAAVSQSGSDATAVQGVDATADTTSQNAPFDAGSD